VTAAPALIPLPAGYREVSRDWAWLMAPLARDDDGRITDPRANTWRAYHAAWDGWRGWAIEAGVRPALPIRAADLEAHLVGLHEAGKALATIRHRRDALCAIHGMARLPAPRSEDLRWRMREIARKHRSRRRGQARGFRQEHLVVVRETARRPRMLRWAKETAEVAAERGTLEAATCGLLHDGLLRVSEACRARWCDFHLESDGSATLEIPFDKTNPYGEGVAAVWISPETAADVLELRRPGDGAEDRILRSVRPQTLTDRLRRACAAAGLPDSRESRWSGHSGRVGGAQDLAGAGFPEHDIRRAGRWRTNRQLDRYTRRLTPKHGGMARFHAAWSANRAVSAPTAV